MQHLGLSLRSQAFDVAYLSNLYTEERTKVCGFHGFPEAEHWTLDPITFELNYTGTESKEKIAAIFSQLMQSWLFFGLIAAVMYDDYARPFKWDDLIESQKQVINITGLPGMLEGWRKWESQRENFIGQNMRIIRAQQALDVARKVIQAHSPLSGATGPTQLDPNLALCLMVLGETLTNAKAKINDQVGFRARDWYGDPSIGWGSPFRILELMDKDGWCPRTRRLLQAQLRDNATALLSAYVSHGQRNFQGHRDAGCNEDEPCKLKSEDPREKGVYATKHHSDCLHNQQTSLPCQAERECRGIGNEQLIRDEEEHTRPTCKTPCSDMIGVDSMNRVVEIIEANSIPLLQFKKLAAGQDRIQLEVVDSSENPEYATISHVWSDGYGNSKKNRLWRCQLMYFRELLVEAEQQRSRQQRGGSNDETEPLPFWIDTLAIPVEKGLPNLKEVKKKAISQIYRVYSQARYTIVIDNDLNNMPWNHTDYTSTAMRILASGWMRRLWTLQEAYLSRKLLFAFGRGKGSTGKIPLIDLEYIEEMYATGNGGMVSSLPAIARSYYHNMLGQDRKARIHKLTSSDSVGLVASVWKAAQWRTTSKKEHETLALATLLNLDYTGRSFAGGEVLDEYDDNQKRRPEYEQRLMEYMKEFWEVLEDTAPGAIPPGIIFLPGDRILLEEAKGFGWAPRSWMEAQGIDYPDPISITPKPAKLEPHKGGLLVEFPGFLLHCQKSHIIASFTNREGFWFANDSSLSEWYHVERADNQEYIKEKSIVRDKRSLQIAIILSRPRPLELPEIGLLVQIQEAKYQRELSKDNSKRIFLVHVIRRVKVKRETNDKIIEEKKKEIIKRQEGIICGEGLYDDQQWYVDTRKDDDSGEGLRNETQTHSTTEALFRGYDRRQRNQACEESL